MKQMNLHKASKQGAATLKASTWLFCDRLIRLGLGFMTGVLIARHYGPSGNGLISYVVSTAALFGSIASLGMDEIGPRDFATSSYNISLGEMQRTAICMRLLSGIVAYCLVTLVIWESKGNTLALSFAIIFGLYYSFQAFDTVEYRLRAEGEFKSIALVRIGASLLSSSLKVGAVLMDFPLSAIAWAMLAEYALSAVVFAFFKQPHHADTRGFRIRIDYALDVLRRSSFVILAGIFSLLQSRVDNLMIEHYLGLGALGQYAAAMKLMELFDIGGIILSTVLVPSFARSQGHELDTLARRAYLAGCILLIVLSPMMAILYHGFQRLYGPSFAPGQEVMLYLLLRPLFIMLGFFRIGLAVVESRHQLLPIYSGLGFLLSVGAGVVLIPSLALKGAALTHVLSLGISSLFVDAMLYRRNLIRVVQSPRELGYFLSQGRQWLAQIGR